MPNKTYDKVQLRVKFTQASNRANIGNSDTNGENIAISFGKLSKWYEALVPTGGSSGKILAWNTAGTAKWSNPLHPTITKSADTTSTASPTHGETFTVVDSVTREANGHVTKINTKTITLPAGYLHPTHTAYPSGLYKITVDSTGHISGTASVSPSDIPDLNYVPNTQAGVNAAINLLSTGSSTPTDADYYISQYVGGGATTTSYHRRPMSALWSYVKSKADSVYLPIGHTYPLSIAADSGTNQLTLSASTKYKLTAGGNTFVFTTAPNTTYSAGAHLSLSSTTFSLASYCKSITDWNSATTNGWYMGYQCTNAPSTAWWIGHVHAHDNKYCIQEVWNFDVIPPDTANPDAMYMGHKMRWFRNSTWGPWVDVSTPTPSAKVNCQFGTVASRTTNVTRGWMAYWDGSYNGSSSNLTYCNRGAFGTIVTKSTTDYSKVSFSRNLTSGTKVGTITIDGTSTDLYCQTNTNTTYSAGTGLSLSGTTFNHSNSVTAVTNYNKPYVKYDAQGHITGSSYWTATAAGTGGEGGWIKVATMVHTDIHDDTPIMLLVSQRGNTITYKLHIVWKNTSNTDPDINKFKLSSDIDTNADAYIKKSATSTWELYIKKLDTWEAIAMHLYAGKYFPDSMTWTWQDVQTAASAITGGIEAEKIVPYNYYQSRTANTVLAAPNGSNGKASFRKLVAADIPDLDYVPNTQEGVIDAINLLSTGSSTPALADYYVSQYANGGTTTTSYHRRPISAMWNAFKGLITLATTGSGNAVTGVSIANDGDNNRKITVTKGSTFSLSTHTHGLLHSDLNQAATNGTTGGWSVIGIDPAVTGYVLKSIRINATSPNWLSGGYGAGIAFGGYDTKGVISMRYDSPVITFAGGNHKSTITSPTWYFKISGTSGSTYDLANFNAATATKLATAQTINGVSFDGSADITIPRSIKHIHTANGTDGSGGWVKIARITVTAAYADQPMTFTITQRSIMQYRIHLLFTNSGSVAATAISEFIITRDNSWTDTNNDPRAYIIKPSDGIFDLYIRKTKSWDRIFVVDFTKADDGGGINYSITWENVHVADSAITGGTEAVKKLYLPTTTNYAGSSSVGGAATYVNGTLTNPTDPIEYSVPFHTNPTTGSKSLLNNDGISYVCREGTADKLGFGVLVLGNGVNSGTAGNKYGIVRMYPQTGKYYGQIRPVTTLTGNRTYQLPDANGNVILGIKDSTTFWGLMDGDGSTSGWIRTTTNGLIPVQSGDAGSGHSKLGTSSWYFAAAYIDNIHGNTFGVGKVSTIDGEMRFYNSGGSGVTTLKGKAQSTNGTYLLPARGNGSYTLSCGHEDLAAATGSLSAANVIVPSYTKFIKIVFKSNSNPILYSMAEIPYFGNGDYSALVQVGTYGDGQNGSPRIVMKAVIINITDGTQTGRKSFTVTVSPTTKINGSSISNFERNITIYKIYAMD